MVLPWVTVELHQPEEHTNDMVNARLTAANVMAAMKFVVKYFSEISIESKTDRRRFVTPLIDNLRESITPQFSGGNRRSAGEDLRAW
jgi:hypothetical protein